MNEDMYPLVLSRLSPEQRASKVVAERCQIASEVLHEARGVPDTHVVEPLELPTSRAMLERLRDVIASIAREDRTDLIELIEG